MTRLRGHHLFCATLFQGSGYDQAFTAQMERTLAALEAGEDFTLCAGPDSPPWQRWGSSLGSAFRPARRGRGCGR